MTSPRGHSRERVSLPQARRTSTRTIPRLDIEKILSLMADDAKLLLSSWSDEEHGSGGDIDCAIRGLDPGWPLRLDPKTRLCQCLEYDLNARYWVLERDGNVLAIDAIDDPHGLGRYAFPSSLVFDDGDLVPPAAVRAAYLAVKRLRKRIRDLDEWRVIGSLAREDPSRFEEVLAEVVGRRIAADLAGTVLAGSVPGECLSREALRASPLRRLRSPRQWAAPLPRAFRLIRRAMRPTGLLVGIVGPDGSGKSTLAHRLPGVCTGLFRRDALFHWRPGVLPRPGALIGSAIADPSKPHGRAPHGRALSTALLLYHWADFLVGSWIRFYASRARTGLVVLERGWWDLLVDPRRYRLNVPPGLVKTLGKLLPAPDVTFLCEAPVDALLARKAELPGDELSRQLASWRSLDRTIPRMESLDAAAPADDVLGNARSSVVRHLEERAVARLGAGWAPLPRRGPPRWHFPRGPAAAAASSFLVYQPMSPGRRVAWEIGRRTAAIGGMRLLPRGTAPPRAVRVLLAPYIPARASVALARANHPGRSFALILDAHGDPHVFVKVATDLAGIRALEQEAAHIEDLGPLLPPPLRAPTVIDRAEGVLVLHAERWEARWRPWCLDHDVARAIGGFFAARKHEDRDGLPVGPAHGDFAPWNLLRTGDGWVVVDWEHAAHDHPAFYDLFHHLVQTHILLHRPTRRDVLDAVAGTGPMAGVVHGYAEAAGVDVGLAPQLFRTYLRLSASALDPGRSDGRAGLELRSRLARWPDHRP